MKRPAASVTRSLRALRGAAPLSLRSHLLRIVLVSLLPLLLFAVLSVVLIARDERATFRRGATERTLALLTAVDTELKRSIAALEVLAASKELDDEAHLDAFRVDAERVLARRPEWLALNLADASGALRIELLPNPELAVETIREPSSFAEALQTGRATVGSLIVAPVSGEHVFSVRVPVWRGGSTPYVLSALVRSRSVGALLAPQGLPADWVGVVLDANRTIVARTIGSEHLVGQPASRSLQEALDRAANGWFHGSTIEGWTVYTPYHRSSFSGWTVAMGIPAAAVEAPLRRSLASLASFGAALLGLGGALAWILSGRSARSIESLTAMARQLGRGDRPTPAPGESGPTRVTEVDELEAAFERAAELIRARSEERDRVEAWLRRVEAELRESDRRKDDFLAMLGHELRNPLGIISTAVQVLRRRTEDDPAIAELREMVERQVRHMARLLDDLLDVSRIARGRIHIEHKPCDLVALVREASEDHAELIERNGLVLEVTVPDRPLWVAGDRTRLAQTISNLIHNACKFTNAGGTLHVRVGEKPGDSAAVLTLRDTGVGMDADILARAFEPFSQADRTADRSQGGLGLGLALVRGLVELHGGEVAASSEGIGCGSTFTVQLPLEPAAVAPAVSAGPGLYAVRPRRILVIEDNRMAARGLELFLGGAGHRVAVEHTGSAGIEAALRLAPDIVLCDIGLPGADGYEVARAIRGEPGLHAVQLLALTGYGMEVDRARARAAGFDHLLTKPVALDELLRILDEGP